MGRALAELLTRFPPASRALRALPMKMALEDRLKLKARDPQFSDAVPESVLTARTVAAQAGTAPVAELALWSREENSKGLVHWPMSPHLTSATGLGNVQAPHM